MNDKEKLRQELLERTFGKNAKNRKISSFDMSMDLENILKSQQESLKDLSLSANDQLIDEINREIEKDFGVSFVEKTSHQIDPSLLDSIESQLIFKWHYDEFIQQMTKQLRKSLLMDKNAYSFLFYNVSENSAVDIIKDYSLKLYQDDISYLSFKDYVNQIDIFYQDMYNCLYGNQKIIVMDYIEMLPLVFLQPLLALLRDKEMTLTKRYVEINGVFKETNNQLVKNAISSLKWQDKIIIFLSHDSLNDLTNRFGTVLIKTIDECLEYHKISQDNYLIVVKDKYNQWKEKVKKLLSIEIINDSLIQYLSNASINENIEVTLENILDQLIDYQEQYHFSNIEFIYRDNQLFIQSDNQEIELFNQVNQSFDEIDQQLQNLIGLKEVKDYLQSLKQYYLTIQKRKQQGKKVMEVSKHMIFTGNPGTGKTTVARILAKYLKSAGILTSGHLIEVSRKDLVGQYVGHTAIQTSQVIASALGGVLFIDEAYSLYRGKEDSFGLEAIDTLVKAMEDHREEFVVILAGYKKEMEVFLESNSGLLSRFSNIIEFKDYTGEELLQIANSIAEGKEYIIDDNAQKALISYFEYRNQREGGNGRLARTVVEKAMIRQASRNSDDDRLLLEDFEIEGSDLD